MMEPAKDWYRRDLADLLRVCAELLILAECTEEVQTCESFAGR